jgi:quercetin dioxygenase-like cupin family protein
MRLRFTAVAAAAALALPLVAGAQDPVKVAPAKFKVLLENDQVRVLEYKAKAGEKLAMHSHPDHAIYNVVGGKTKFTTSDGKTQESAAKSGEAIWVPATTHSAEHLADVHGILIELKKAAKK